MNKLGIYCPTFGRPHEIKRVADDLKKYTKTPYTLYFGLEPGDVESIRACDGYNIVFNNGNPCYSDALQAIYEATKEPYFLWANDDFHFTDGWDVEPMKLIESYGVVGLHDSNPHTRYFSISLVNRKYIEDQSGVIDMPNRVLYPYSHNYVDDELTETAQSRGKWTFHAGECIIHKHHSFAWLPDRPEVDDTYRKNDTHLGEDTRTFSSRRSLWS